MPRLRPQTKAAKKRKQHLRAKKRIIAKKMRGVAVGRLR